jgi:PiT family inorganic phosphate transporter
MLTSLIFLSGGLFLGWSHGANNTANVFGTAVGTKMIKFRTAAIICSIFIILGSVISGAGAAGILNKLGSVNEIGGAFTVTLSAAIALLIMTRFKLPASTTQSVVGAIIGWNFFAGAKTDYTALTKILATWLVSPLMAAAFSAILFLIARKWIERSHMHLITLDARIRRGLILVGAFGAYSLGANNIANVMGVFIKSSPFRSIHIGDIFTFSSTQILFFIGGIAIAVGVFTYSYKVIQTVGSELYQLSPVAALIVVFSNARVLFIFASENLKGLLESIGLPSLPLVPISSSQGVIGAIMGIALTKSLRNVNYGILGKIGLGWICAPLMAGLISYFLLFFMQNVFMLKVYS